MTYEAEGLYFAECERRERTMERHATDPRVATAHAEMADRYEALAVVFAAKRMAEPPTDF